MAISSRNLFHFTDTEDHLIDILKNGFLPRYCLEKGWSSSIDFAVLMVCFCDIPLTQIAKHVDFYGKYGIGVSKSWAGNYKITPVQYIASKSKEFNSIGRVLTKLKNKEENDSDCRRLALVKKVFGMAVRRNQVCGRRKFYDEREWRYLPDALPAKELVLPVLKNENFEPSTYFKNMEHLRVKVDVDSIRYIFIPTEKTRYSFAEKIEKFCSDSRKRNLLMSKIITLEQIKDDF